MLSKLFVLFNISVFRAQQNHSVISKIFFVQGFLRRLRATHENEKVEQIFAQCFPQLQNCIIEQKSLTKQNNKTKTLNKYIDS